MTRSGLLTAVTDNIYSSNAIGRSEVEISTYISTLCTNIAVLKKLGANEARTIAADGNLDKQVRKDSSVT